MGFFITSIEEIEQKKLQEENSVIAQQGDRFCYTFTSSSKDWAAQDAINAFLRRHPDYRIVCMTSGLKIIDAAAIICYFEKIK